MTLYHALYVGALCYASVVCLSVAACGCIRLSLQTLATLLFILT